MDMCPFTPVNIQSDLPKRDRWGFYPADQTGWQPVYIRPHTEERAASVSALHERSRHRPVICLFSGN